MSSLLASLQGLELARPWALWLLPLPLLALLLPAARVPLGSALRLPFELPDAAVATARSRLPGPRLLLALPVWVLLCIAAAQPQRLGEIEAPPSSGRPVRNSGPCQTMPSATATFAASTTAIQFTGPIPSLPFPGVSPR